MRVNSKGQVTIHKRFREKLGMNPNTEVDFVEANGRIYLQKSRKSSRRSYRFQSLLGLADIRITTEEILALTRGD